MTTPQVAELVLDSALVLTMDAERRILEGASVAIRDGRIAAIGPAADIRAQFRPDAVLDCAGKAILPGLVDLHGYLGRSILKSFGESLDGMRSRGVFDFVTARAIDEDWWEVEARLCALDRLKFGTTFMFSMVGGNGTRTDDPAFTRIAARELARVGLRARIGIGPGRPPWPRLYSTWRDGTRRDREVDFDDVVAVCDTLLAEGARKSGGLVDYCTALSRFGNRNDHDPVWSPEREAWVFRQAEAIRDLMARHGVGFWTHAYGNAVAYAHDEKLGLLGPGTILSHCTGLDARAIDILRETGTHAAHHPRVTRTLQHPCPVAEMLAAGVTVALGSDAPTRHAADLFLDIKAAMRLQRARLRDTRILPPGKALAMATIDGARALGLAHEIGSVETGKAADLITIDLRQPHLRPLVAPAYQIACHATGQDVRDVVVAGRLVMRDRRMLTIDEDALLDEAEAMFRRVAERAGLAALAGTPDNFWGLGGLA